MSFSYPIPIWVASGSIFSLYKTRLACNTLLCMSPSVWYLLCLCGWHTGLCLCACDLWPCTRNTLTSVTGAWLFRSTQCEARSPISLITLAFLKRIQPFPSHAITHQYTPVSVCKRILMTRCALRPKAARKRSYYCNEDKQSSSSFLHFRYFLCAVTAWYDILLFRRNMLLLTHPNLEPYAVAGSVNWTISEKRKGMCVKCSQYSKPLHEGHYATQSTRQQILNPKHFLIQIERLYLWVKYFYLVT